MSNYTPNMTYTNNPFIDYILYYTKILSFGAIIKDEDLAQENETRRSILSGDALISCIEGTAIFELFTYDEEVLRQVGFNNKPFIQRCEDNPRLIPDAHDMIVLAPVINENTGEITGGSYKGTKYNLGDYISIDFISSYAGERHYKVKELNDGRIVGIHDLRKELAEKAAKKYIYNYTEYNNYYRKLAGLPNIGDSGIPIMDYEYIDIAANTIKEFINTDKATYVHELNPDQIAYLKEKGVMDAIKADYPDADYLDYLGNRIVDFNINDEESVNTYMARKIYKLRKAYNFQLLYVPDTTDDGIVEDKFKKKYEENRLFVIHTFYSDVFKQESDYYNSFIAIMIMIMTITDMLSEVHEHIIKKDFMDKRCIQYIFEMYGMPYFSNIPLKYQYRLCKNINQLIRYKSSTHGMLDIIDLFGAENIEVFKYFILRDRNVDKWGNFIYNEIVTKTCNENDVIKEVNTSVPNTKGNITIPYPVLGNHYLTSGNTMIVMDDNDTILDYTLSSDKSTLTLNNYNGTNVKFRFYYNKESVNPYIDKDNTIHTSIETGLVSNAHYTLRKIPISTYFVKNNDIVVILDGKVMTNNDEHTYYTFDKNTNTLVFSANPKNNNIKIIYIYGTNTTTRVRSGEYICPDKNTNIPMKDIPFTDYLSRGNFMLVYKSDKQESSSSVLLHEGTDYIIDDSKSSITLKTYIDIGTVITFVYIYSSNAEYATIDLNTSTERIIGTKAFQSEFKLHPPFENYFKRGYKAFIELRNSGSMLNSDLYDIYNNTLSLRDQSIGLQKGQELAVTYVYGPDIENIQVTSQKIIPETNKQTVFTGLTFPMKDFFSNHNNIIVDVIGTYLEPNKDFTVDESTATLTILNPEKAPTKDQYVNITYYVSGSPVDMIKINRQTITMSDDTTSTFNISLPFYPYTSTGHSIVPVSSTTGIGAISSVVSSYSLTDTTISINNPDSIKSGNILDVFAIYNNKYENIISTYIKETTTSVSTTDDVDNNLSIDIKYPFDKYQEHDWPLYVTDENNKIIDENDYTIVNDSLSFLNPKDLLKYNTLTIHFLYFDNSRYIYDSVTEDYDKDITMKFIGVNISDPYFNKNIIQLQNVLPYDDATLEDEYWDGVGYGSNRDEIHKKVKNEILAKKFNYERTKYYGINYVYDIANMTFQIAYFYNIFYDNVPKEDELSISVPSIVAYKKFLVSNLFVYMSALAYLYSGVNDNIIDTSSKVLYIKGFNFRADLPKLKKWIWDQRRNPNNFDTTFYYGQRPASEYTNVSLPTNRTKVIWDFNNMADKNFGSMKQVMNMLTTHDINVNSNRVASNASIYNFIVHNIYESQDHDIFAIWKKLYDSLMTYRQSFEFYKITLKDGTTRIAKSLTEFLKYKDTELYNSLMDIKSIGNTDERNEQITNRISDIVYILEEYIDLKNFSNVFDKYPGVSGDFFLDMIFTIINFFKSYKIVLRSKGDYIVFSAKDPYTNTLRLTDVKEPTIELDKYDYYTLSSNYQLGVYTEKDDDIKFTDHIDMTTTIDDISNADSKYIDAQKKNGLPITNTIKVKVDISEGQIITVITDSGLVYTTNIFYGTLQAGDVDVNSPTRPVTNKRLVSYFYSYLYNGKLTTFEGFTLNTDDRATDSRFMLYYDPNNPNTRAGEYGDYIKDTNGKTHHYYDINLHKYEENYIEFTLHYGEQIYTYVTPKEGYTAGILNMRQATAGNEDIHITVSDAIPLMRVVRMSIPDHVHVTVYTKELIEGTTDQYKKIILSNDNTTFTVKHGTRIYLSYTLDNGFNYTGKHLYINGNIYTNEYTVNKSISINADTPNSDVFNITIKAPDNVTIKAVIGNNIYTIEANQSTALTAHYYDKYRLTAMVNSDYISGKFIGWNNKTIPNNGVINYNIANSNKEILFTMTNPTIKTYTVTIVQEANQTIRVVYNGVSHTSTFTVPIHAHITTDIFTTNSAYTAGRVSFSEMNVIEDVIVTATPPVPKAYTVSIASPDTMTDVSFVYGENLIEIPANTSKQIPDVEYGNSYSIKTSIISSLDSANYILGTILPASSGIINDSISDSLNRIKFTINPTILRKYKVSVYNPFYDKENIVITSNGTSTVCTDADSVVYVEYSKAFTASAVLKDAYKNDYIAGTVSPSSVAKVVGDTSVVAQKSPELKQYTVTIGKYDNQEINVFINDTTNAITDTFTTPIHTKISAAIISTNPMYDPGALSTTSIADLTSNVSITATAATLKKFTVNIASTANQTVAFTINGKTYGAGSTITVTAGDSYSYTITPASGYKAGIGSIPTSGIITEDTTLTFTSASK